jgi:hypothetical protein
VLVETGGGLAENNLAAGKTAFAKDELGVFPHAIARVNDGLYGNANSWIAGTTDSFVGINLGASPVTISRVAFGRDNQGVQTSRVNGIYTLQFTSTPNPGAATPEADWNTVGIIAYPGTITNPALRHRYSFAPVQATGFRIKVQTDAFPIAIDELELYASDPPPVLVPVETGGGLAANNLAAGKTAFAKDEVGVAPPRHRRRERRALRQRRQLDRRHLGQFRGDQPRGRGGDGQPGGVRSRQSRDQHGPRARQLRPAVHHHAQPRRDHAQRQLDHRRNHRLSRDDPQPGPAPPLFVHTRAGHWLPDQGPDFLVSHRHR